MKIPFWLLITLIIIVTYLFYLVLQCNKTESFINMNSDFGSMVKFETVSYTHLTLPTILLV